MIVHRWQPQTPHASRTSAGFSLGELLFVLTIVATLIASATISLGQIAPRFELWRAARQVVMDLSHARLTAIAAAGSARVTFRTGSREYVIERPETAMTESGRVAVSLADGVTIRDCSARDDTIQFGPRGTAANFGTVTLTAGKLSRRVIVTITGQVRSE